MFFSFLKVVHICDFHYYILSVAVNFVSALSLSDAIVLSSTLVWLLLQITKTVLKLSGSLLMLFLGLKKLYQWAVSALAYLSCRVRDGIYTPIYKNTLYEKLKMNLAKTFGMYEEYGHLKISLSEVKIFFVWEKYIQ